jgi:hypothetical protein
LLALDSAILLSTMMEIARNLQIPSFFPFFPFFPLFPLFFPLDSYLIAEL